MRSFIQKLNELDHLIREERTDLPAHLGEQIGISERSVFDYLKIMRELGAPICYSRTKTSYFYEQDGRFHIRFKEQN